MGRIRHELPLPLLRALEPVEHLVHRAREPRDLVASGRLRHSTIEGDSRDRVDLHPHRFDGRERAAGQHPHRHRDDEQQDRQADQQELADQLGRFRDRLEGARRDHGARTVGRIDLERGRDVPVVVDVHHPGIAGRDGDDGFVVQIRAGRDDAAGWVDDLDEEIVVVDIREIRGRRAGVERGCDILGAELGGVACLLGEGVTHGEDEREASDRERDADDHDRGDGRAHPNRPRALAAAPTGNQRVQPPSAASR